MTKRSRSVFFAACGLSIMCLCLFLLPILRETHPKDAPATGVTPVVPAPPDEHAALPARDAAWVAKMLQEKTGPLKISEVRDVWRQQADQYASMLRHQTLTETLFNLSLIRDEWLGMSFEGLTTADANLVEHFMRTRRFNHAIETILQAGDDEKKRIAAEVASTVRALTAQREELVALRDLATSQEEYEDLSFGILTEPPLSAKKYGVVGTALGMTANTFLLGLCGQPQNLEPLLRIAAPQKTWSHGYATKIAAVDAMDRIIMRSQGVPHLPMEAQTVVDEYVAWRNNRRLPERQRMETFSYESPGTPYNLLGNVAGMPAKYTQEVELPFVPAAYGRTAMFSTEVMEDPEQMRAYEKICAPQDRIVEVPSRGLTMEDMKHIPRQAERLLNAINK